MQGQFVHSDNQAVLGSKRNDDIEILRGVAIVFVFIEHLLAVWDLPRVHSFSSGYFSFWGGVDLFFAISGYVIAHSILRNLAALSGTAEKVKALVEFWIRRAWRLWPAAWFWLLVPFVAMMIFDPHYRGGEALRANCASVIGSVLNVTNIQVWRSKAGLGMQNEFWSQYWSLSLEEQFYLVAAPLLLFVSRRWVVALMIALVVAQVFFARVANSSDLSWFVRSDAFAWGVLIAILWNGNLDKALIEPTFLRKRHYAWLLLGVMLTAISATQLLYSVPFDVSIIALASGALVFVASFDKGYLGVGGVLGRVMSWVGDRSYAIYLVHGVVIGVGLRVGPLAHLDRQNVADLCVITVALIVVTLILSELSYRFIEVPARLHGRKLAQAYHATCDGAAARATDAYAGCQYSPSGEQVSG